MPVVTENLELLPYAQRIAEQVPVGLNQTVKDILKYAPQDAASHLSSAVETTHLLSRLIRTEDVQGVLMVFGVSIPQLDEQLQIHFQQRVPEDQQLKDMPLPSPRLRDAVGSAITYRIDPDSREVTEVDLLNGIITEGNNHAYALLKNATGHSIHPRTVMTFRMVDLMAGRLLMATYHLRDQHNISDQRKILAMKEAITLLQAVTHYSQ